VSNYKKVEGAPMRTWLTVAATCTAMVGLPVAVAVADKGGGSDGSPGRSGEAPGQVKKQEGQQAPAQAAPQQAPAEQRGGSAQHRRAPVKKDEARAKQQHKAKEHAKPQHAAGSAPGEHAKAGKTTICHSTGSASNPYVMITVSDNALPAHGRHHDGRDIIPAPAGGCPSGLAPTRSGTSGSKPGHHGGPGHGHEKVTICHATGSATNPYVTITIAEPAVEAHRRHQDGRDIIPAPAAGCPKAAGETVAPPAAGGETPGGGGMPGTGMPPATGTAPGTGGGQQPAGVLGDYTTPLPPAPAGTQGVQVLGETASGSEGPQVLGETAGSGTAPGTEAGTLSNGSLPFTGLDIALAALVAAAALLAGVALRRAVAHRA
jgi:hypothetical protein